MFLKFVMLWLQVFPSQGLPPLARESLARCRQTPPNSKNSFRTNRKATGYDLWPPIYDLDTCSAFTRTCKKPRCELSRHIIRCSFKLIYCWILIEVKDFFVTFGHSASWIKVMPWSRDWSACGVELGQSCKLIASSCKWLPRSVLMDCWLVFDVVFDALCEVGALFVVAWNNPGIESQNQIRYFTQFFYVTLSSLHQTSIRTM